MSGELKESYLLALQALKPMSSSKANKRKCLILLYQAFCGLKAGK